MNTVKKHNINLIQKVLLITLIMIAGILIAKQNKSYAAECVVDNITYVYETDSNGNAINVTLDASRSTPRNLINIPESLDGHRVVSLGNGSSFVTNATDRYYVKSVASRVMYTTPTGSAEEEEVVPTFVIPQYVTRINNNAFKEMVVDKTNFNNLQYIGDSAFESAVILGPVLTPWTLDLSSAQYIGKSAFQNKAPNSPITMRDFIDFMNRYNGVTFGNNLTQIGDNAFSGCVKIKNISLPTRQITIGNSAFSNTSIESITIPSVWQLGNGVFSGCKYLTTATLGNGITKINDSTFSGSGLEEINLPSGITEIGNYALSGTNLDTNDYNQILNNCNIKTIGNYAFSGSKLNGEVVVPSTITSFGSYVFQNCKEIESAKIQMTNITALPTGTFEGCTSLSAVELPGQINEIGYNSFKNCTSLSLEVLYNNILVASKPSMIIRGSAFENCTGLVGEFSLPGNVTQVGQYAFQGCTGLTGKLKLEGDKLTEIEKYAFADCSNVDEIIINESNLTIISERAFYNTAVNQKVINLNTPIRYIFSYAFTKPEEIYVNNNEANVSGSYRWYGQDNAVIHYNDCTHSVEVVNMIPGVSVKNTATNEAIDNETVQATCNEDFTFTVDKESYTGTLVVKVISEGKYYNSDPVEEFVTLDENNSYTFSNINRDKKVIIQRMEDGTDLVLRTFITGLDNRQISSRIPKLTRSSEYGIINFDYNHTKQPLIVKKGQKITYTIRAYNQGNNEGNVNEITVRIPDQLKLVENNDINTLYGWTASEDGRTIKTTYLNDKAIDALEKGGKPQYQEVQIVCEVQAPSENDQNVTLLAEISAGNDYNSIPNDAGSIDLATYMTDESWASNKFVYVKGIEDDTDYETVQLNGQAKGDYNLILTKIDGETTELLDGAKIRLYDENMQEIKTIVTQNGEANFGAFTTQGEGTDTYYIEEVETPVGYKRTVNGKIELNVVKTLNDNGELEISVICDVQEIADTEDDADVNYIPVTTAEQLAKIGSGEDITVNGTTYAFAEEANYKLQNDINLEGATWTPIKNMKGTFDGNNKTISNVTLSGPSSEKGIGFFQSFEGTIKNLTLKETLASSLSNSIESADTDKTCIGGLVGYMKEGKIENCNVEFTTSSAYTSVENVGGLVGLTDANGLVLIKDCNIKFVKNDGATQNIGAAIGYVAGNATIINCKNNGSSYESMGDNGVTGIGGFVGYAAEGSLVTIEDSTNSITIKSKENAGGMIGTARSGLIIRNCVNNADIGTEEKGNSMGGLVGYVEPTACTPKNIGVVYEDGVINVYLTNKEKVDTFKLNILKVNIGKENIERLDGAKFNVYKKDGDNLTLIKENVETENGEIAIDNIPMTSMTNDVYYVKEVEAPQGYDLVVKDAIKVHVTAEWDGVNEKYIINPEISVVSDIEADTTEPVDSIKGNATTLPVSTASVKWKTNKVIIEDSINYGSIQGNNNIGGLIGTSKGYAVVENSHNKLKEDKAQSIVQKNVEEADSNAGGIIGCASVTSKEDTVDVYGCTNEMPVEAYRNAGGIIGSSYAKAVVSESSNKGKVSADNCSAGGIVGVTLSKITIDGCENESESITAENAGGILGNLGFHNGEGRYETINHQSVMTSVIRPSTDAIIGFFPDESPIIVTNCTTKNTTISGYVTGGIIGSTGAKEEYVENCVVEKCNISAEDEPRGYYGPAGGIQGHFGGEEFHSKGNIVRSSTISGYKNASGVLASYYGCMSSGISTSYDVKTLNSYLDDCHVYGSTITADLSVASGMISYGYRNSLEANVNVEITNCTVEKDSEGNRTAITCNSGGAAGIFGSTQLVCKENFNFDNNKVMDVDITSNRDDGGCAGIVGYLQLYESTDSEINITRCDVINCNLKGNSSGDCATSGILSGFYCSNKQKDSVVINIDRCNVNNTVVTNAGGDIGGIVGNTWSCGNHTVTIKNCNVTDFDVSAYDDRDMRGQGIGGIYGNTYSSDHGTYILENNTVEHIIVNRGTKNVGGIFGYLRSTGSQPDSLTIKDCKCIGKATENGVLPSKVNSGTLVGGILGGTYFGTREPMLILENVECSDFEVVQKENIQQFEKARFAGGIIGEASYGTNTIMKNIKVSNINIDIEHDEDATLGCTYGGLAGGLNNNICDNIEINNVKIKANKASKSAIGIADQVGYTYMSNVKLKNSRIDVEGITNGGFLAGGLYGVKVAAIGNLDETFNVPKDVAKDVEIDNITINANKIKSAGLFAAEDLTGDDASNVTIKNSSINAEGSYNNVCVGGMTGVFRAAYATDQERNYKNIKLENVNVTLNDGDGNCRSAHAGGIAGYAMKDNRDLLMDTMELKNVSITNNQDQGYTGGIVGCAYGYYGNNDSEKIIIQNVNTENVAVTGNYTVAGILGEGRAIIENVTVKNPKITAKTDRARAGGIAAIIDTGSTVKDATVTADEGSTEYGVFSDSYAGGFAYVSSATVENAKIENLTVKTLKNTVSSAQNTSETSATPNSSEEVIPYANAKVARYGEGTFAGTATNVKLIIGTQEQTINE